jgi:diaminopimelate decarboxylase
MPNALLARLGADFGLPQFIKAMQPQLPEFAKNPILEVETGRFIVGNAAVAITEVVNKKVDLEVGWLHVDISTNFLVRIDTSKYRYAVLPVLESIKTEKSIRVVGETCIDSTIEPIFNYINVKPGELLAILDTGMYTMSTANNFNTVEKPIALLNTSSDGIKVLKY